MKRQARIRLVFTTAASGTGSSPGKRTPVATRPAAALLFAIMFLVVPTTFVNAEPTSSILERAAAQLGTPYRSGGIAPGGFDCSGFVFYLYRPTLPSLPRISRDMAGTGSAVNAGNWLPGDLLFYATGSDPGRINHVAIWYGDGYIIHSISGGPETGVVMTPADSRYWRRCYVSSRRVIPAGDAEPIHQEPNENGEKEEQVPSPPPTEEIVGDENPDDSPWNDFDGVLRGDWEEWKKSDQEAFEEFLRKEADAN